jgi:Zn-dependent protease
MNFFQQGIPLGRWFRITVVLHWTFLLYAANELFGTKDGNAPMTALYLVLLFGTVLAHEFGHALSCRAVGGEAFHIVLWPLGGMAFVQPPNVPWAWLVTTVCGPLVNAVLWPVFWFLFRYMALHAPADPGALYHVVLYAVFFMYHINRGLLLFNLIPAYPMDGGRILQEVLWMIVGYGRSLQIAGMVGTVAGVAFIVLGLGLQKIEIKALDFSLGGEPNWVLVVIGLLGAMQSFAIYRQSQEIRGWRKN